METIETYEEGDFKVVLTSIDSILVHIDVIDNYNEKEMTYTKEEFIKLMKIMSEALSKVNQVD